jgi:hypothetical protein
MGSPVNSFQALTPILYERSYPSALAGLSKRELRESGTDPPERQIQRPTVSTRALRTIKLREFLEIRPVTCFFSVF